MSFIVAIDGPAGSGKGTVAKLIGERLNLTNIDTGAMFRCIALQMQRENVKLEDEEKIKEILDKSNIELKTNKGILKVYLNGEDVSTAIRTEEVSNFVSPVSTIKIVREKLLMLQRKIAETQDVVMEGRDIGTAVFPNANVKIFLVASIEERAKRRMKQLQEKGEKVDFETILQDIKIRDERDSTRDIAPLRQAEDAILVDSSNLQILEVVQKIEDIIKEKMN